MKYFFNSLRKMDFKKMKTSQALRIFKFHYMKNKIEKKEYKYLVKQIFKKKKRRNNAYATN